MNNQIHCPKCGSTQITAEKKGFSGGKAAAGAVLTGGIGLLAGTIGSNDIIITCLACGNQFKPGEGIVPPSEDLDTRVRLLITGGKKLDAVKLVQKERGISPMEAANYIRALNGEPPIAPGKGGCAGIALLIVGLGALLLSLLAMR